MSQMLKRLKSTLSSDGGVTVSMRVSIDKVVIPSRSGSRFAVRWSKGKHKGTTPVGVLDQSGVGAVNADLDFNTTLVEGKKKMIGFRLLEAVRQAPGTEEHLVSVMDLTFDASEFYYKKWEEKGCRGSGVPKEVTLGTSTMLTLLVSLLPTTARYPRLSPSNILSPFSEPHLDASYNTKANLDSTFASSVCPAAIGAGSWRSMIVALYKTHGVGYDSEELDAFLESYKGNESELYEKLQAKYEPNTLSMDQRNLYSVAEDLPSLSRIRKEHTVYASSTDPMSSDYPADRRVGPIKQCLGVLSSESEAPTTRRWKGKSVRELAATPPSPQGVQNPQEPQSPIREEAKWGPDYLPATVIRRAGKWVDVRWENGETSCVRESDVRTVGSSPTLAATLPEKELAEEAAIGKAEGALLFGKAKLPKDPQMHHETAEPEEDTDDAVGGPLHGDYDSASTGAGGYARPDCFSFSLPSRGSSGGTVKSAGSEPTAKGDASSAASSVASFSFNSRARWDEFKEQPSFARPHWRRQDDQSPEVLGLGEGRETWRRL